MRARGMRHKVAPRNCRSMRRYNPCMIFSPSLNTETQRDILRRLMWMRIVAITGQFTAVAIATWGLGIDLPLAKMLTVIAMLAVFNAWTWWGLRRRRPAGHGALFTQLFVDLLAVSSLLFFSGGATNPFVSVYLPALAVAAAILPWRYTLVLAVFALAGYSLMMTMYVPLPIPVDRAATYHLAGLWANFALSAALITWFVARMSSTLRDRDAQLARAREQQLQNERIVALGTQAASAAHEIGTPLATIAVIAGDLLHEMERHPALKAFHDDVAAIETQIAACKASLDRLGKHASADAASNAIAVSLDVWLARFVEGWRLRHPGARLDLSLPRSQARLSNTAAVGQVLLTLLDNAARAVGSAGRPIALSLEVASQTGVIRVHDAGPGIHADLLKRLGHDQVDSTTGGQGMGLMLAFATARQIGGAVRLSTPPSGGTLASTLR